MSATTAIEPGSGAGRRLGFWSLIAVQFQGAFSDNLLKWLVTFLALGMGLGAAERDRLVVLIIPLLFAVPFLLFSMAGGYLADKYSKRSVTIDTKLLEIIVALAALAGLAVPSLAIQCAAVFLISVQAALFGPSKYGLLPELLPERLLSWGNGILELGTFLAIITGTMAAGLLADRFRGREQWPGALLVALAVAGLAMSFGISRVPAADPRRRLEINPVADLRSQMLRMRRDRLLSLAVAGNTFFWFLGALILINTALYAADVLKVSGTRTSLLLAAISIGIGAGSFIAGYFSGNKIEYGLTPLGAVGIAAMTILLSRPGLSFSQVAWRLGWTGFFGGFFAVPVSALIQHRPRPEEKGGIIAAANLLSFVGIALQPVAQYLLIFLGHPPPSRVFLLIGLLTLGATAAAVAWQPDSLLRLGLWLATHAGWPLRVEGRDKLPPRGPAVLVMAGSSQAGRRRRTLDALLVVASTDRTLRWLLPPNTLPGWARRLLDPIPLEGTGEGARAATSAVEALRRGEVVCLPVEAGPLVAAFDGVVAPASVLRVELEPGGFLSRSTVRFGAPSKTRH